MESTLAYQISDLYVRILQTNNPLLYHLWSIRMGQLERKYNYEKIKASPEVAPQRI